MNFQHLGFEYEVSYSKFVDETSLQIVKACAGKGRRYGNVGRVEIYKSMVEFAEAYGLKGL